MAMAVDLGVPVQKENPEAPQPSADSERDEEKAGTGFYQKYSKYLSLLISAGFLQSASSVSMLK
jgi:hypothetical protein